MRPNSERFFCPRRTGWIGKASEGLPDSWETGRGLVSQELGCSACGSLPPEKFLELVRAGAQIDPTDKAYKLYVHAPEGEGKFYTQHLSEQQGWDFYQQMLDKAVHWGYPGYPYTPLYLPGVSEHMAAQRKAAAAGEQVDP